LIPERYDILKPLMIFAFVLMGSQIFFECMLQGALAKENQLIETLVLERPHAPVGKGVGVGRPGWEFERLNARGLKDGIESLGEFGIAILEEKAGGGHGANRTVKLREIRLSQGSLGKGVMPARMILRVCN
jgi:hypothetical protein